MKTQHWTSTIAFTRSLSRGTKLLMCSALGVAGIALIGSTTNERHGFVAHEWGTFTSVQGADGALMDWRPLETLDLPKFVYNWSNPGFGRASAGPSAFSKAAIVTRQRMETPVIYFYADEELTANVSVKFPQGTITEWYPQARQIGPATVKPPKLVAQIDSGAHKVGVKPEFTFASLLPQHAAKDSRIVWSGVRVLPAKRHSDIGGFVPLDKSGSHYFAARETDAAFLRVDSGVGANSPLEHERFLFYRGVGNFATPLVVTMSSTGSLTVTNKGTEALLHLFVLNVRDGKAKLLHLNRLDPKSATVVALPASEYSQTEVARKLADEMASALVSAGLFQRETVAMVNTWKDSWFADEGVRVLYLLPPAWTDTTLPLEVSPRPQSVIRVMVGRAEVITPELENRLRQQLTEAQDGNAAARSLALAEVKKLGRFAQPAMQRIIMTSTDAQLNQLAWTLLLEAANSVGDPPARRVAGAGPGRSVASLPSSL